MERALICRVLSGARLPLLLPLSSSIALSCLVGTQRDTIASIRVFDTHPSNVIILSKPVVMLHLPWDNKCHRSAAEDESI